MTNKFHAPVELAGDPANPLEAATKQYVDSALSPTSPISLIQTIGTLASTGTSVTSAPFTVPASGVPIGDVIQISGGFTSASIPTLSVSDTKGNTYTVDRQDDRTAGNGPHSFIISSRVKIALVSGDTITVAFSSGVGEPIMWVLQYHGLPVGYRDVFVGATAVSGAPTTGNLTTTAAGDLLVSTLYISKFYAPTFTLPDGYTLVGVVGVSINYECWAFTKNADAIGVYASSPTLSTTAQDWAISLGAYKRVSGIQPFWDTSVVVSVSDKTTTGQALVDITGLTAPMLAASVYEFEAILKVGVSAVVTGQQFGVNCTQTPVQVDCIIQGVTTTATVIIQGIIANNTANATAMNTTSSGHGLVFIRGIITTHATLSSTFSIRHLKVTSGTSTIKIGSTLKVRKVA